MKSYLITGILAILLSSCLKQSIPDAMLSPDSDGHNPSTATMSYELNGNPVKISVSIADDRYLNSYTLGCSKTGNAYDFDGISSTGEMSFVFYTDSLAIGNYTYTGIYGDMFIASYNNTNEFVHVSTDSMSYNITSYKNGYISGNFSGRLTPMVSAGYPYNIYDVSGSVLITKGLFQNVPVYY